MDVTLNHWKCLRRGSVWDSSGNAESQLEGEILCEVQNSAEYPIAEIVSFYNELLI